MVITYATCTVNDLMIFRRRFSNLSSFARGDGVGGSNTSVCARKLCCEAWELEWNVDIEFFVRIEKTLWKELNECPARLEPATTGYHRLIAQDLLITSSLRLSALMVQLWFLLQTDVPIVIFCLRKNFVYVTEIKRCLAFIIRQLVSSI